MWSGRSTGSPSPRGGELSKRMFLVSTMLLVLLYGMAAGRYELFPFPAVQFAKNSVELVVAERQTLLKQRPSWLVKKARYEGSGVTRFDRPLASPGLTLLSGFFEDNLELRLIALDGTIVNRWPVEFSRIFPENGHVTPEDRWPQSDWNTGVQGSRVFPDGSLVFNFEGMGSARLDRCGGVQWTLPRMTHHSVDVSADGTLWIPSTRYVEDDTRFPGLLAPFDEDTILRVSPDGRVLDEISLLELFFENGLRALLFANGVGVTDVGGSHSPTHLNDIEELTPNKAVRFPQFAAGDLLLSVRNYNLLMVVDPASRRVKWHETGPWLKQHDPDFEADGTISVFSNNTDGTSTGSILGGSTIIDFDPRTRRGTVRYGGRPDQKFFTNYRGKHQRLENGNELVAETEGGRVFEIDPSGRVVWEFINQYEPGWTAIVSGALRYPNEYFTVRDWTCR